MFLILLPLWGAPQVSCTEQQELLGCRKGNISRLWISILKHKVYAHKCTSNCFSTKSTEGIHIFLALILLRNFMQEIRFYQVTNTAFRRMQSGSSVLSYSDMVSNVFIYLFSKILLSLLPNFNMMPQVSQKPSKLGRGLRTHFVCAHAPTGKPDPNCSRACSSQDVSSATASKLWQSSNPRETSQSGRSQVNNLIKTTSRSFFLLTFNILHINFNRLL